MQNGCYNYYIYSYIIGSRKGGNYGKVIFKGKVCIQIHF